MEGAFFFFGESTNLAFVAVDEERVVGTVEDDTEGGGHVALRDCDKGVFVGFDADTEMLDAVFREKGSMAWGVVLRNEGTERERH